MSKNPFESSTALAAEALPAQDAETKESSGFKKEVDLLKKTALDKKSPFEKVSLAIDTLISLSEQEENIDYEENSSRVAKEALMEIYTKRKEYFFQLKINRALTLPLESMDVGYKKSVLERDGFSTQGYSAEQIESIFLTFIHDNYEYCRWSERSFYTSAVEEKGYKVYGFGTYQEQEGEWPNERSSRRSRVALENSTFSKLCSGYGAKYVSDSNIQIFKTDPLFEADLQRRKDTYGPVSEDYINYYATYLERSFSAGEFEKSLTYLQGLSLLSEKRREGLLRKHNLFIPQELLGNYTFAEREAYIKSHKQEASQLIEILRRPSVAHDMIDLFRNTEQEMRSDAEQKFFGYRSFDTDQIDFFLSFYDNSPRRTRPPHHTFFYYAYIRKSLPQELVQEFEEEFGVHIPSSITQIETYDDFLNIPEDTLFSTFGHLDKSAIKWLRERIVALADSIQSVLPKATYLSLEEFFIENSIPEEEVSKEFVSSYSSLMDLEIRSEIETRIGFSLAELDLPAQIAFLEFLSRVNESEFDDFCQFIKGYEKKERVAICSAYLAFQDQKDFSYIVERICQHKDIGLPLIQYIYTLIGNADSIRSFLNSEYKTNYDKKIIAQIHQTLIKKAYDILLKYNAVIANLETIQEVDYGRSLSRQYELDSEELGIFDEQSGPSESLYEKKRSKIAADIIKECSFVSLSQTLLLNTFKTLKESGATILLEDFRDSEFLEISGSEIDPEEIVRMRALYTNSMQGYPDETKKRLLDEFDAHLDDKRSTFFLFRYKGEIAGFMCFTEENPGQKYVSAVTLDPRFQKAYIGETMIDEAFAREAQNNILAADCVAQKSVSARYIENGFIGVRSWDDKGDLILDIIRDDARNEKYFTSKSLSQEEIIELSSLGKAGATHIEVVSDPKEHSFALCNEGFVLTRYFKDTETKKWYLVYEPRPNQRKNASSGNLDSPVFEEQSATQA